jgi:Tfp pilus assembly protein PilE
MKRVENGFTVLEAVVVVVCVIIMIVITYAVIGQ